MRFKEGGSSQPGRKQDKTKVNIPLEQILDRRNEHTLRHLIASARQVLKGDSVFLLMDVFIYL
uniref:Uncharacterized protein n=1 Tax=Helianthus annuus TaxID=4232 RepID=A0A251TLP0_HELAN